MKQGYKTFILGAFMGVISANAFAGAADDVMAHDAYARAVPEGQKSSAAFMTLHNGSAMDHAIVSAESPVAKIVELHTHVNENGMMKMRRVDTIDIGAGAETVLQPGGLHVMLINLNQQLVEGDNIPVTLVFEDGTKMALTAPVKKLQMKMMNHQHNNQSTMGGSSN